MPFLEAAVRERFRITPADRRAALRLGAVVDSQGRVDWAEGPLSAKALLAGAGCLHADIDDPIPARAAAALALVVGQLRRVAARAPDELGRVHAHALPPRPRRALELLQACLRGRHAPRERTWAHATGALSATQLLLAELEAAVGRVHEACANAPQDSWPDAQDSWPDAQDSWPDAQDSWPDARGAEAKAGGVGGADTARAGGDEPAPQHAKLKDMLRAPAVRRALGEGASLCLHALIGPLRGLSLRNLCWHGYLCPADLDACAEWPCLLLLIVACGLPPAPAAAPAHAHPPRARHAQPPPSALLPSVSDVQAVLALDPPFVDPLMRPALLDAVRCARAAEHWRALGLLYVVIESSLRGVYARANLSRRGGRGGARSAAVRARVDRRHHTLEAMLNWSAEVSSARAQLEHGGPATPRSNALLGLLGEGTMGALFDEFIWAAAHRAPPQPHPQQCERPGGAQPAAPLAVAAERDAAEDGGARRGDPGTAASPTPRAALGPAAAAEPAEPPLLRNHLVHGGIELADVPAHSVARHARLALGLAVRSLPPASRGERALPACALECARALDAHVPTRHPVVLLWQQLCALLRGGGAAAGAAEAEGCGDGRTAASSAARDAPTAAPSAAPALDAPAARLSSRARAVRYCALCTLPPELCAFGPTAARCVRRRLGLDSGRGLPALRSAMGAARARLAAERPDASAPDAADVAGAAQAGPPARPRAERALLAELAALLERSWRVAKDHQIPDDGHLTVARLRTHLGAEPLAPGRPPRRWSEEAELGAIAVASDALDACARVGEAACVRVAACLVEAEAGNTRGGRGRSRRSPALAIDGAECALLSSELCALLLLRHWAVADASLVLPTALSQWAGAMSSAAASGHWPEVVALAAALTAELSAPEGAQAGWRRELLSALSARDATKYRLDAKHVLGCAERGEMADLLAISESPLVVNIASDEARRRSATLRPATEPAAADNAAAHGASGKWRLQREKLRDRRRRVALL